MKLYQFTLPLENNRLVSYDGNIQQWTQEAAQLAGGVTAQGQSYGTWKSNRYGLITELVANFLVAVPSDEVYNKLLQRAFELFPDQQAIFTAHIGEAWVNRKED